MNRRYAVMILVLLFVMQGAIAEQECIIGSPQQRHLYACVAEEGRAADEEMNSIQLRLQNGFWDTESEQRMKEAQVAWLRFVEADCKFQKPNYGGRVWRIVYESCVNAHKRDRIVQLKKIPACGNGCIYN